MKNTLRLIPLLVFLQLAPLLFAAQSAAPGTQAIPTSAQTARPLADILAEIETRFDVTIDCPTALSQGKILPYADYRLRRYSVEESLRNVLAPFDLMFEKQTGLTGQSAATYRVRPFDAPRRPPADGIKEMQYLTAFYKDKATWQKQAALLRPALRKALLLDPMPRSPGTPIHLSEPRRMNGYNVQNFALETLPGVYVCGSLYSPANTTKGKQSPLILNPNGHTKDGRYRPDQQYRCAMQARMGAYAICYDLFGWGESLLQFAEQDHRTPMAQTMQILNGLRLIDAFSALPEIDADRIAITGASGGGTQSMMLTAIDERIKASAPVVMVSAYFAGGCPCESGRPVHLCAGGMNNAELAALAAPRPQLIVSDGKDWTADVPVSEYPFIKYIYTFYDAAANVSNFHLPVEGHDYGPSKRKAVYPFLAKTLGLDLSAIQDRSGHIDERTCTIEPFENLRFFGLHGEQLPANAVKGLEELEAVFAASLR